MLFRSQVAHHPFSQACGGVCCRLSAPGACEERTGKLRETLAANTSSLAFLAARRLQWPIPGGESQGPRIPKRGELHHHGLPDRGPDSGLGGFMNSTLNVEEPLISNSSIVDTVFKNDASLRTSYSKHCYILHGGLSRGLNE